MLLLRPLVLFSAVMIAACASAPQQVKVVGITDTNTATSFKVIDERPPANLVGSKMEGGDVTSVFYGDDQIAPPPLTLVRAGLSSELNKHLEGKIIKLKKFQISVTRFQGASRNYQVNSGTPTVLLAIAAAAKGLESESNTLFRIISNLEIEIDGIKIEHSEISTVDSSALEMGMSTNIRDALTQLSEKTRNVKTK